MNEKITYTPIGTNFSKTEESNLKDMFTKMLDRAVNGKTSIVSVSVLIQSTCIIITINHLNLISMYGPIKGAINELLGKGRVA